jgi:hypothetical protein
MTLYAAHELRLNMELAKINSVKLVKERETGDDSVSRLLMTVVKRRRDL